MDTQCEAAPKLSDPARVADTHTRIREALNTMNANNVLLPGMESEWIYLNDVTIRRTLATYHFTTHRGEKFYACMGYAPMIFPKNVPWGTILDHMTQLNVFLAAVKSHMK